MLTSFSIHEYLRFEHYLFKGKNFRSFFIKSLYEIQIYTAFDLLLLILRIKPAIYFHTTTLDTLISIKVPFSFTHLYNAPYHIPTFVLANEKCW